MYEIIIETASLCSHLLRTAASLTKFLKKSSFSSNRAQQRKKPIIIKSKINQNSLLSRQSISQWCPIDILNHAFCLHSCPEKNKDHIATHLFLQKVGNYSAWEVVTIFHCVSKYYSCWHTTSLLTLTIFLIKLRLYLEHRGLILANATKFVTRCKGNGEEF